MFSPSVPSSGSTWALPVLKLPPGGSVELVIASSRVLYCGVHWVGRCVLCVHEDCPGCEVSVSKVRGFAIALVTQGSARRPVIVEASSGCFFRLEGAADRDGFSLAPGLRVQASRRRKNSPLVLEPLGMNGSYESQFTPPWRLAAALAVLFKLSAPASAESVEAWTERVRSQARTQLLAALSSR